MHGHRWRAVSLAWLAYVPVPGLALVPALARPDDRFHRYHARQGGWFVGLWWLGLILWGLLIRLSEADGYRTVLGAWTMLWILAGLAGAGFGAAWSTLGVYGRLRPVWDLLVALKR